MYELVMFGNNKKIIDIQDKYYYNIYHLNGAINIPYDELMNNYRYHLNKNTEYYKAIKNR